MKAFIITIGDELLIGQVTDTNSGWIARKLTPLGISIVGKISVSDEAEAITNALDFAQAKADLIIITGGLGPTKDDLTVQVLADYFKTELVFNENAFDNLKKRLHSYEVELSPSHRAQSYLPESAILLDNSLGTAPGMWFEQNEKIFIAIPGVPREMKAILEEGIIPKLLKHIEGSVLYHTFLIAGIPESQLAEKLEGIEEALPVFLTLAYLPQLGNIRLRIGGIHEDKHLLAQAIDSLAGKIRKKLGTYLVSEQDVNFAQAIGKLLVDQGKTLATAESCTGGNVAHLLTLNSGSSAYFKGSVVAYANEVKKATLGVKSETLAKHGAVSKQTAEEMAIGVRKTIGTDYGIATTGIAGPTGGTPEKPVGTIWIAVSSKEKTISKKLQLGNNRLTNIEFTSVLVLNMLRKVFLIQKEP